MTTTKVDERQEDFIQQLLRDIREGDLGAAVGKLNALDVVNRIHTLSSLLQATASREKIYTLFVNLGTMRSISYTSKRNAVLASIPDEVKPVTLGTINALARDLISALTLDLITASELPNNFSSIYNNFGDITIASELTKASLSARALAAEYGVDFAVDSDNYGATRISLFSDLFGYLNSARVIASKSSSNLVTSVLDYHAIFAVIAALVNLVPFTPTQLTDIQFRYQKRLGWIYDEVQYQKQQLDNSDNDKNLDYQILEVIGEVIWTEMQQYRLLVTLEGADGITPDILSTQIAPYMQALQGLQAVHAEITGEAVEPIGIVQMHNAAPKFEVKKVEGFFRGLYNILDRIYGEPDQREADIRNTDAQTAKTLADIKNQQLEQALKISQWETDNLPRYLEIADTYLMNNYPQLTPDQRLQYTPRVAHDLMQIALTKLQLRIGWHDMPRPPSVPELPNYED